MKVYQLIPDLKDEYNSLEEKENGIVIKLDLNHILNLCELDIDTKKLINDHN
jgi:hypothetical protein